MDKGTEVILENIYFLKSLSIPGLYLMFMEASSLVRRFNQTDVYIWEPMRIHSHYYKILTGESILLPIVEIDLVGPRNRARIHAVVDSGATDSVFPIHAAQEAGLSLDRAKNYWIQYGSGRTLGKKLAIAVDFCNRRLRFDVVFVEVLAFRYALLGRSGVFARFTEVAFMENTSSPRVEFRR